MADSEVQEYDAPIDIGTFQFSGFKSEKDMCNYIEDNIELFCVDVTGEKLRSYKREYTITGRQFFAHKTACVDFLIVTESGKRILVEVKNPKQIHSEMIRSVSQLLAYGAIADMYTPVDRLILATSNTCEAVQLMICKYELPIEVVLLNRDIMATWDREWARQWQDQQ